MDDGFRRFLSDEPVDVGEPRLIRAGAPVTRLFPVPPDADPSIRQPFVNERLNSRLATTLATIRPFVIRWKSALPPELRPQWVLQAHDRIAVVGASDWRLLDLTGAFLIQGMVRFGSLAIDPEKSVFYLSDLSGFLAVRSLKSGKPVLHLDLFSDDDYFRSFVARRDRYLVAVSTEMPVDLSRGDPKNSLVEIVTLSESAYQEPQDDDASDLDNLAALKRKTNLLHAAMNGDTLVLATEDRVYFADPGLKIRAALAGSFLPLAMSVNEGGHVYLLVHSGGQTSLWLLTENGERLFSFPLPAADTGAYPPILGYDHTAFLLAGGYIFAVAPDGRLEWSRAAAGELAGAVVTADGFLLVTEGSEVAAYNARGEREVLFTAAGDRLTTPPILTAQGDLLVASNAALYCLTAR